ncbi:hypothetical protein [Diaphorobacter aerolatus]|uniref:Uncharacterized protein n=1 Tax=Diaphorobacter aerolatus TaxID=1288495 RepID=A0A7H0GJB3_9BURK|nr:hypothetical protein [Diaphorobacter aerolatus]QNP48379.1 hypothetical protein H9K75_20890 [Diaphorobacter aerolatus]
MTKETKRPLVIPNEKLPQVAIIRMNKNKNGNFVLENLPEGAKPPPEDLTCINCAHAGWTANNRGAYGYCEKFHKDIHTPKEIGTTLICSHNIPLEDSPTQPEPQEEQPQEQPNKDILEDPFIQELLGQSGSEVNDDIT